MEKREPWEKKSTFSALSVYQRILLLLLLVMIAAFTGLAFWFQSHPGLVCIRPGGQRGPAGPGHRQGETVRYSGQAGRTERGVLRHRRHRQLPLGEETYGPYQVKRDPTARPPYDRRIPGPAARSGWRCAGRARWSFGAAMPPRPDAERLLGQKSGVGGRYRL